MKLLFDQNLAPALVSRLADVFPESLHVRDAGLEHAPDEQVWQFALERGRLAPLLAPLAGSHDSP